MKTAFKRTPQEAVRSAVDALGGLQEVGHALKGADSDPILAGQWLSHCLQINASNRHKLSLGQLVHVFRQSVAAGHPEGAILFAELCGLKAEPVTTDAQLAAAVTHAAEALHTAQAAMADLRLLQDNPRLMAILQASHVDLSVLVDGQ